MKTFTHQRSNNNQTITELNISTKTSTRIKKKKPTKSRQKDGKFKKESLELTFVELKENKTEQKKANHR